MLKANVPAGGFAETFKVNVQVRLCPAGIMLPCWFHVNVPTVGCAVMDKGFVGVDAVFVNVTVRVACWFGISSPQFMVEGSACSVDWLVSMVP